MTYEEVADKFRGCCTFAKWPKRKAEALVEMVARFETLPSLDALMALARKGR